MYRTQKLINQFLDQVKYLCENNERYDSKNAR